MKHNNKLQRKMYFQFSPMLFSGFIVFLLILPLTIFAQKYGPFLHCLSHHLSNSTSIAKLVHTPNDQAYLSVFSSTIVNPRVVLSPSSPKPLVIVTPSHAFHVQGHSCLLQEARPADQDSEWWPRQRGPLLLVARPVRIIDLRELGSAKVDVEKETAWVEAGATLGEVFYLKCYFKILVHLRIIIYCTTPTQGVIIFGIRAKVR